MKTGYSGVAKILWSQEGPLQFHGTGFLVSPRHVLTCAHVLREGKELNPETRFELPNLWPRVEIRFEDSSTGAIETIQGETQACDADLALICLDRPVQRRPFLLVSGLTEKYEELLLSGTVIGFARFEGEILTDHLSKNLSSFRRDSNTHLLRSIDISGGVYEGTSGGPFALLLEKEPICLGMARLGGQGRAVSQIVLSDTLLQFLVQEGVAGFSAIPASELLKLVAPSPLRTVSANEMRQQNREALEELRKQSALASSDAGIIELSFGATGEALKLDQELYVTRKVESEVIGYLQEKLETGSPMVLIVGEAGYGKTSLLWHLYQTLPRQEWEPWFMKSSFLSRWFRSASGSSLSNSGFDQSRLFSAIAAVLAGSRKPVLLLDTVDLLLHDEANRDDLRELLQSVSASGCAVVVTCRHQEARLLQPLKMNPVLLGKYDDDELLEAVEKHVKRFSEGFPDPQEQLSRLCEAVARGRPVKDVCSSPLMLRMLFLIYAPQSIPDEIHAFRLYKEFWEFRVESDRRAENPSHSGRNLERACWITALTMLAEGTPEPDEQVIKNTAAQHKVLWADVEQLVSRGVLKRSETGTLSFFHQTFFEHGAARAMLRLFHENGLLMLDRRMENNWSDLFCAPVLEQALLLAENDAWPVRSSADAMLPALLRHPSITAKTSGIYVYCHRKQVPDPAAAEMDSLLRSESHPLIDSYLRWAPNLPPSHLETLFLALEVIWKRGRWAEQEFMLAMLERMAFRAPARTRNFLEEHQVLRFVIGTKANNVAERKLARVLMALSRVWAEWSLEQFIQLFNGIFDRTQGTDAPVKLLAAMAECAEYLGAKDLATRFDQHVPPWKNQKVRDFDELARAYGHLWFLEWTARRSLVDEVVQDIDKDKAADKLRLYTKLEGLAELLLKTDSAAVDAVFEAVSREKIHERRWAWISVVLKCLMLGDKTAWGSDGSPRVLVYKRLASILLDSSPDRDKDLGERIRRMICETSIPPQLFVKILGHTDAPFPELWLDSGYLAELLPEGYVSKHPIAELALIQATKDWPQHEELLISVRTRLTSFVKMERRIAKQYLNLTFLLRQTPGVAEILPEINQWYPGMLQSLKPELEQFLLYLMTSRQGKLRRAGVALWQQMLQLDLTAMPLLEDLFAKFDREEDTMARSGLLGLMGLTASKSKQEIQPLIDKLRPLTTSENPDVRTRSRSALISSILRSRAEAACYGFEVLELVLQPPTDSKLAGELGYVLQEIQASDPPAALEFCCKLLVSTGVTALGLQSKRTLSFRLRQPVRALIHTLTTDDKENFLKLVPTLDHTLGGILVDAICHEQFNSSVPLLNELLEHPGVSPEIKDLIRRAKYNRERTGGGQAWPELFQALRLAQEA
jgi:hypothetical protein